MNTFWQSIVGLVVGSILTHFWNKYKSRCCKLTYAVWHTPLGASANDPALGSLEILYNKQPVPNLFLSTVMLCNASKHDLDNLDLNIICDSESTIYAASGRNKSSLNSLQLSERFLTSTTSKESRRDFHVPVLNREDEIEISLIVTNQKNKQPIITVGCDHRGVITKFSPKPEAQLLGESLPLAAFWGIAITLVSVALIDRFCVGCRWSIWLATTVALFASVFGALLIKAAKFIGKIFD